LGIIGCGLPAFGGEFKEARFSLIHAQNEGIEESIPLDSELRESLEKLFGYEKYRVVGEVRSSLKENKVLVFEADPAFSLKITRISTAPCLYEFDLLQEKQSLLKGQYHPKAEVPLIIRGPFYDQGNLVLVVRSKFK
jgi:hypothetical protein